MKGYQCWECGKVFKYYRRSHTYKGITYDHPECLLAHLKESVICADIVDNIRNHDLREAMAMA